MQRFIGSMVILFIPFANHASAHGESTGPIPEVYQPVWPEANGMTTFRQHAHFGYPWSPTLGFRHYDWPSPYYGLWYRPRAAEVHASQRCAPDRFRPRGYGHLFYRRRCGHRLDYAQYRLTDPRSNYGPEYFGLQPDPRCKQRCHHR